MTKFDRLQEVKDKVIDKVNEIAQTEANIINLQEHIKSLYSEINTLHKQENNILGEITFDYVNVNDELDMIYQVVKVIRKNKKSVTIKTVSSIYSHIKIGQVERIPLSKFGKWSISIDCIKKSVDRGKKLELVCNNL